MPITTKSLFLASMDVEALTMSLGGEQRTMASQGEPTHTAIHRIESPDVLLSRQWAEAGEAGRWPDQVRPHTTNRRHVPRKVIEPGA